MNEQMKQVLQNLCEQVVQERDPKKLLVAMRELDELLADVQQQERKRAASAASNSSANRSRAS